MGMHMLPSLLCTSSVFLFPPLSCLLSILFLLLSYIRIYQCNFSLLSPSMYIYMALHVPPFPCLTPLPACSLSIPPSPSSQLLQVRDLSGEAMRLSALYPGGNAKGIMAKQEVINTAWESLTLAIQGRKKMLRSSLEFQKFLSSVRMKILNYNCFTSAVHSVISPSISRTYAQVRDNISWMHDMEAVIESDEPAKSVSGAEEQLGRHEQHRVSARS